LASVQTVIDIGLFVGKETNTEMKWDIQAIFWIEFIRLIYQLWGIADEELIRSGRTLKHWSF